MLFISKKLKLKNLYYIKKALYVLKIFNLANEQLQYTYCQISQEVKVTRQ